MENSVISTGRNGEKFAIALAKLNFARHAQMFAAGVNLKLMLIGADFAIVSSYDNQDTLTL